MLHSVIMLMTAELEGRSCIVSWYCPLCSSVSTRFRGECTCIGIYMWENITYYTQKNKVVLFKGLNYVPRHKDVWGMEA